jgi:F0F1-type ATP synthase assembly protein I
VKQDSTTQQVHSAVNDGWMHGGSFLGSVLAGTLLGYFLDMWLGTDPWLVAVGIVVGSYAGFVQMWVYLKRLDDRPIRDR